MKGPCRNGSSGTTIEVLFLLTVAGASALTLLALRTRRELPAPSKDEDGSDVRDEEPNP